MPAYKHRKGKKGRKKAPSGQVTKAKGGGSNTKKSLKKRVSY